MINKQRKQRLLWEEDFTSARDFLKFLNPVDKRWEGNWIFRGQFNSEWDLLPKVWRPGFTENHSEILKGYKNQLLEVALPRIKATAEARGDVHKLNWFDFESTELRYPQKKEGWPLFKERHNLVITECFLELELFRRFLVLGEQLGFDLPNISIPPVEQIIDELGWFWARRGRVISLEDGKFQFSFFDLLEARLDLAQHHGLPTRLLDWTGNPYYGAHFAISGITATSLDDIPEKLSVWCLNRDFLSKHRTTSLFVPPMHIHQPHRFKNPYLLRQEGLFSYFWNENEPGRYMAPEVFYVNINVFVKIWSQI